MLSKLFSMFNNKGERPLRMLKDHSLYHYSSCPFCFRVQITMTKLGIDMEKRNIHQGSKYYDELKQEGGSTMVPCLRIEKDGKTQWMYESADIVHYLEANFPKS
jgi:glutathione S-transferase